ncbi:MULTISPECIES: hypothetical protein [Frankia]|nr:MULTISPECIES: hypothetical protein [Frankia]
MSGVDGHQDGGKIFLYRDYLDPLALAAARSELSTPAEQGAG